MTQVDGSSAVAVSARVTRDAGFWKRALALVIDACIVATLLSVLLLSLAFAFPGLGKFITLNTPFGIGTIDRTIQDKSTETAEKDGTKVTTTDKIIERSVLDRWVYRFRVEGTATETQGDTFVTTVRTWQQIDPVTGQDIDTVGVDGITLVVLMLYWIIADASRYQGSLGKRLLGLKVVGERGERLSLAAAAGRNLLKILSAVPMFIGFMMAGWTRRKQALHDKLASSYVITEL